MQLNGVTLSRINLIFFSKQVLTIIAYVLLAKFSLEFALKQGNVTMFWPAGGFALAVLIIGGKAYLPAIFIAAFLTGISIGDSIPVSLAIAIGNTLEAGLIFVLLQHIPRFHHRLENTESFLLLVAGALVVAPVSAIIGPLSLWAADTITTNHELFAAMQYWWMGDVLGIIFLTPIILVCCDKGFRCHERVFEIVILFLITALVGQTVLLNDELFHFQPAGELSTTWITPLVIWAALRTNPRITALLQLQIFMMALSGASLNIGYFGRHIPLAGMSNFWMFGMMVSVGGMVLAINNSERRRLLKRLEFTQFVMDHAPVEVYWVKSDGRIDYVNKEACRALGYSQKELLQLGIPDLDPDYDNENWQVHWRQLINNKAVHIETNHRCKNGTLRPIEVDANYVKFNNLEYNVAFARDISERKQEEATLQASEHRFRDLFNYSPDPCWLIEDNHFIDCNIAATNMMGYRNSKELLLAHPANLSPYLQSDGEQSVTKANNMMDIAREKGVHRFEWQHQHRDGYSFPVEVTLTKIQIDGKDMLYGMWRDISEQKRIMQRLEKEHKQLIKTEEIAHLGSWKLDIVNQELAWSDEVFRIFGYRPQEFLPTYDAFHAEVHPDDKIRADNMYQESILTNQNEYLAEHRIIHHSSGEIRYVLEKCEHLKNAEGKIYRSVGMVQDITEQKRMHYESERLAHSVAASVNEIYLTDAETLKFIFVNIQAQRHLGYKHDEFNTMTPLDIKLEFDRESFERLLEPLRTHEKSEQIFETTHRTKDGQLYPVEVHLQLFEPNNEPSYFQFIVVDISEKQQLEAKLSSVFNAVNAIIWSTDDQMQIEQVSPHVEQLLGYPPETFYGVNLLKLLDSGRIHPEDTPAHLEAIENMLHTGVPIINLEHRVKTVNDEWKWMTVSITPLYDANHKLRSLVGVVNDISQQKQAEADLRRLSASLDQRIQNALIENRQKGLLLQQQSQMVAMGEMIGNIAHQWRQPLNSLAIILMDLEDGFLSGDIGATDVTRSIQRCNELLAKMSSTIDDFRNFFRKDKRLIKTDIGDVIVEATSLLEASLSFYRIQLQICQHHDHIEAWSYPGELSQALLCLINNAKDQLVKQNVDQGKIVIEIDETSERVVIRVSDNGGGIPEQHLPKIFVPYFTTKDEGTGLGLYITKLTIEQSMRGQIKAENITGGACFTILLPKGNKI